jgi:hypothetical protein
MGDTGLHGKCIILKYIKSLNSGLVDIVRNETPDA